MTFKQKILVIVGSTSSGKSALAVELARRFDGEIISADSRQVYRGMDIGTGKITRREMRSVPHHLLDVVSPKKTFTAHEYLRKGRAAISDIAARGKLPIVVGGTGFYIDVLLGRITLPDVPADHAFRRRFSKMTTVTLKNMLAVLDPRRAKQIDSHNKRRLIRALEIARAKGKRSEEKSEKPMYNPLWLGLDVSKEVLDKKISARLRARMKQGMLAEARRLHLDGLSYKKMESFGLEYRSLARLLKGKTTKEAMLAELDVAIRQYAKRQRTYWRRNKDILWFRPSNAILIQKEIRAWLGKKF